MLMMCTYHAVVLWMHLSYGTHCRTDAKQAHVRTLLTAGRCEEAAESARELFEDCTEAGQQVCPAPGCCFREQVGLL